jgi:hypothetical protein
MPKSTLDAMVPADVVKAIVGDHYKRAAPTPPAKSIVDEVVEKFGPKPANFRHDALKAQLAGVRKHERAVLVAELKCRPGAARASRLASVALRKRASLWDSALGY